MRNPLKGLLRFVLSLLGLGFLTGTMVAMSMEEKKRQRHDHDRTHMREDIADRLRRLADHIEESGVMGEEDEGKEAEEHEDEAI